MRYIRVAVTLAKQRLMTSLFDYYELAHPEEGVGSGFKYETVPHMTLKSIANNEPAEQETLMINHSMINLARALRAPSRSKPCPHRPYER